VSVYILKKWKSLCFTGFFLLTTSVAVRAMVVPDSIKNQLNNHVQHADLKGITRLICSGRVEKTPPDSVSSYLRFTWDEYAQKRIFPTIYSYSLSQYKQFLDSARAILSDSCLKRLVENSGLAYELNYYYGYYYSNLGDYSTAEEYFSRSFEPTKSPQSTPPQDAYNISLTYQQVAFGYLSSGDYEQALEFFQTSLSWLPGDESFYEQINSQQFYRSIRLSQMGECYQKLQQYDSSQRFLNRSLRIQQANLEQNDFQSERYRQSAVNAVRQTLERLVNLYRDQEEYAIALDYLNQSQQLNASGKPDFETLKISADISMARDKPLEALARYRASLARIEETFGRNSLSGGQVLLGIARAQLKQGEWLPARKTIQQGFSALSTNSGNEGIPEYDSLLVPLTGWEMLLVDIEARINQTLQDNGDLSLLLEEINTAMDWADNLRVSYTNASAKQLLAEQSVQLYEESLFTVWQLFQETGQQKYLGQAFQFMERSKGSILRDAVLNSKAKKFAGIPESLQEEEKQLKGQVAYLKTSLTEARSSEESAAITRQLLLAKQSYESFISKLEQDFPRYFQFKYSSAVPEAKMVQEQMSGNEMIISFFAGDDYWYRIALQANDIAFTRVPNTPELQQQVAYLTNALSDEKTVNRQGKRLTAFQKFSDNALGIYRALFGQPLDNFTGNRLVIIPDGRLGYLPLHILINKEPEQNTRVDYAGLPYLFKKYAVRRQYSVSLMLEQQRSTSTSVKLNYAGFAPDFKGTDKLLFNNREVEAL
jgi:tetratricopeptide (TPR) repeat protein